MVDMVATVAIMPRVPRMPKMSAEWGVAPLPSEPRCEADSRRRPVPPEPTAVGEQAAQDETTSTTEPPAKRPHKDFSIYKTPSGKFYCLPCNLTMNSETQFAQHFESKKHKSEVAKQRSTVRSAY
ncbi:uncharacterized protein LOC119097220 [Pollicipes pollicipes]|uniref:uncharacterized protein LOC119097220 n=1 Tax=Pollicipes pollicipes TaxID=41117 RepID=UPI0018854672|nr:uncharacterized protein LOC119097220 [Pollicipes pollicipes]